MTKQEVLDAMQNSRSELLKAIDGLTPAAMQETGVVGYWSLRDALAHLNRWEAELVRLLFQLKQGQIPDFPTLTERDFDKINDRFYKESLGRSIDLILEDLHSIRKQTIRRLGDYTDQEITEPDYYPAIKGNALLPYIAGNTFEHEVEHTAQILEWRKLKATG
jgi:hypothetical protein